MLRHSFQSTVRNQTLSQWTRRAYSFRDKISKIANEASLDAMRVGSSKPTQELERLASVFSRATKSSTHEGMNASTSSTTTASDGQGASHGLGEVRQLNQRVMKTWHTASQRHGQVFSDPSIPYMPKEFRTREDTRAIESFDRKGRPVVGHFARRLPNPRVMAEGVEETREAARIRDVLQTAREDDVNATLEARHPWSHGTKRGTTTGGASGASSEGHITDTLVPSDLDIDAEVIDTLRLLKKAEREALIQHTEEKVWTKRTELRNPSMEREAKAMGIRDLYRSSHLDASEKKDLVSLLESEPDSVTYEPLATFHLKHAPDFKQERLRRAKLFGREGRDPETKPRPMDEVSASRMRQALRSGHEPTPSKRYSEIFTDAHAAMSEDEFIGQLARIFPHYSHQMLQSIVQRMYESVSQKSDPEVDVNQFQRRIQKLTHALVGDRAAAQKNPSNHHPNLEYVRDFPSKDLEEEPIVYSLHEYMKEPREVKMVKIIKAFKKLYKRDVSREEMLAMESLSQKYEPVLEDIKDTGDYNLQEHCNILYNILQPIIEDDFVTQEPEIKLRKKRTRVVTLRASGKGSRKSSHARCILTPGTGILTINGKCYTEYFRDRKDRLMLLYVYKYANCWHRFDVDVRVHGGGTTGQSAAAQLAMVNALIAFNPKNKYAFRLQGMLTRDKRRVERKKPGQKKARKKFAWVKR